MVRATVATTPFAIEVVLIPDRMHIELPAVLSQANCLFAAVAADPAVTVTEVKSTVE